MHFLKAEISKSPSLVNNFYFSIIFSVINGIVNVIYPLFIGIYLGPVNYSSFAILLAIINLFILLNESVLLPSSIRFVSSANIDTRNEIYSSNWIIYFSLLITAFILFSLTQTIFSLSTFIQYFIFCILLIFITLHRYLRSVFQGLELYRHLDTLEIISLILGLLSLILILVTKVNSWESFFYPLIVYQLTFTLLSVFSYNVLRFKPIVDIPIIKKILRYGFFVGLGSLFSLGLTQYQIIFTSSKFSKLNTGQVAFWSYLVFPFTIFILSLTNAIFPRMVKLSQIDQLKVFHIFTRITKYLIIISMSIVILLNLVILNVYNLKIHFLISFFNDNGLNLAVIYLVYGGGLVVYYSMIPLFSIYESRIYINSILPFTLMLISVVFWNFFLSSKNVIIIPIGLFFAVFVITILEIGFITYYEQFDINLILLVLFYYITQLMLIYFNILDVIVKAGPLFTIMSVLIMMILLSFTLYKLLIFLRESTVHFKN